MTLLNASLLNHNFTQISKMMMSIGLLIKKIKWLPKHNRGFQILYKIFATTKHSALGKDKASDT